MACKKGGSTDPVPIPKPLATLGLYQYTDNTNKRIFISISQIGSQPLPTPYFGIFDTGSSGLTIDANGLIPASMITANGIQFPGDSISVNGITITNKTARYAYGDATGSTLEYGNLAYAPVTIGNSAGSVTTKRIAFFLYYKIVDGTGKQLPQHSADVFGVGPGNGSGFSYAAIESPLNGFTLPVGITSGFKLAKLSSAFTIKGDFIQNLLTIGLVPDDLATTSGFVMHPLTNSSVGGYSPNIPATITYGATSTPALILFDTGAPSVSVVENSKETKALGLLPANTDVTITTNKGFVYKYTTTSTGNLTQIQNPNISGDLRSILSIDFFVNNESLTNYAGHIIGLKN
ncbi:hypothetical protein [Mucilaginibacter sp. CSA2-8R]|uniref:hypothetical protein n=1 Tax=Mucilaginibacter sp. CSA2-8R TaxID=3141542 RepID=UPI00315E0003